MAGFIFGIIFILVGVGIAIGFAKTTSVDYKTDDRGNYIYNEMAKHEFVKLALFEDIEEDLK